MLKVKFLPLAISELDDKDFRYNFVMTKFTLFLFIVTTFMFSGCVNRRGVSAKYYNDCSEYYDSKGYYHKDCDENMLEFEDVKNVFKSKEKTEESSPASGNVW